MYGAYDFHEANTKFVANLRENLEPVYGAYMFLRAKCYTLERFIVG